MAVKPQRSNLDFEKISEIQNAKIHNVSGDPQDPVESQIWYNSTTKKMRYNDGTTNKDIGRDYTFSSGLTENSGTVSVTDYDKLMKNTATANYSLTLKGTSNTTSNSSVNIGFGSAILGNGEYNITVGGVCGDANNNSSACSAFGIGSFAKEDYSIAIGANAQAKGLSAIQIGAGDNLNPRTLNIGFTSVNDTVDTYQLLNGNTGLIPDARLSSNIARTSDMPTVNNATLTIQKNGTTVKTFTANASSNVTCNITVPTAVTDLSDASNYAKMTDIPTIPTKLSDFTDDLGSNPTHTHSQYLTSHQDISGKADKATTLSGYGITDAYTKTEIDGKLTGAMHYKGTVATVSALDNISNPTVGDVYNVTATGDNYAYDGTNWDKLSGVIDLSVYNTHIADTTIHVTSSDKTTWNGKQDAITSSAKLSSDLVDDTDHTHKFVTSTQITTWNNKQRELSASNKLNPAYINTSSSFRFVTDTEKSTWNGKQDALGYTPCKKLSISNTALTQTGGQVTFEVDNTLATVDIGVHVYDLSTGEDVTSSVSITVTSSKITVKFNSTSNIAANSYRIVAIG